MKRLTVTIHRVETRDIEVGDGFDPSRAPDALPFLLSKLHRNPEPGTRILSVRATEGADLTLHHSGDPYILIEGGLVKNTPALPVIDLDILDAEVPLPGDGDRALESARIARSFGLNEDAARLEAFAHASNTPTLPGL